MSGTCFHFIRAINPANKKMQKTTDNPMSLHDSYIKLDYLGLLFFTRMLKIINKLFLTIDINFNCCSVDVNLHARAEEKNALTET